MHVFEAAAAAMKAGRHTALATLIGAGGSVPRRDGTRMLVFDDGSIVGTLGGGQLEHRVIALALECLESGTPMRWQANLTRDLGMCCGGHVEVLIEPLEPNPRIVIFGAGHVAHATAPLLRSMDFQLTVADERPELATVERFEGCTLHHGDPLALAKSLPTRGLYVLVTTHDHRLDQDLVECLLPRGCHWLGLIGSRTKVAKFSMRFRAAGMDEALIGALRSPVGLNIGAQTPVEIALSIAAELVAVRRGVTVPA